MAVDGLLPLAAVNVDQAPGTPALLGAVWTVKVRAENPVLLKVTVQLTQPRVRLLKAAELPAAARLKDTAHCWPWASGKIAANKKISRRFFINSPLKWNRRARVSTALALLGRDHARILRTFRRRRGVNDRAAFVMSPAHVQGNRAQILPIRRKDRKSTRLNSSHGYNSYAVF